MSSLSPTGLSTSNSPLFRVKRSTAQPKTNQVLLSLQLNHPPDHVFTPGELIVGVVVLVSFEPLLRPIISVSFSGKLSTRVAAIEYKQSLFHFSKTLYQSSDPDTLDNTITTHSWPFSFHFPSHCTLPAGSKFQENEIFAVLPGTANQPLPPSLTFGGKSGEGSASITYRLKTTLASELISHKASRFISFCPPRTIRTPLEVRGHSKVPSYLLPNAASSSRKPKAQPLPAPPKKGFFSRSRKSIAPPIVPPLVPPAVEASKPLKFMIAFEHPVALILGDAFPFAIRVMVSPEDLKSFPVTPTFTFESFEAHLASETSLRSLPDGNYVTCVRPVIAIRNVASGNDKVLVPNVRREFRLSFGEGEELTTSFKSVTVGRRYKLHVTIKVGCMGTVEKYFREILGLGVWSSDVWVGEEEGERSDVGVGARDGDRPPEYDRVKEGSVE